MRRTPVCLLSFVCVLGFCGSIAGGQENQIINGEFDAGFELWGIYAYQNTTEGFTVEVVQDAGLSGPNAARFNMTNSPALASIGIAQGGLLIEPGKTYPIGFTAKAAQDRGLVVLLQANINDASWPTYLTQTVELTTAAQDYVINYTHEGSTIGDDVGEDLILYLMIKGPWWHPPGENLNGAVWIDRVYFGAEIPRQPVYFATTPDPKDGAVIENMWTSLSWKPGDCAASHNIYLGENLEDVNNAMGDTFRGNQIATSFVVGFVGYPYPDGLVPGTTYYWRIDEVNTAEPNSPWKGPVWRFSIPPRTAYDPIPADGAESVALNSKLTWTGGFGAKLHTVYLGTSFDDVNNAKTGGVMSGMTTYSPASLKAGQVYYWRVDETDPPNKYKGQVWSFTTPGAVGKPHPPNGNTDAEMNTILSWTKSTAAASHEVYFGTDKDAVRKATATSPEYKGVKALGAENYDPGLLPSGSTYYWRIDEVNNANPASPWKGPQWTFTTGKYLLIEDFESYNDIDPPGAGSNRIFDKWIDGFGTTNNGAVVGNNLPPYAERTIIHGGE